jgi:prepilin-type N-terminal cleavage/methylation domain-containing protein
MTCRTNRSKRGFTLIELMAVVIITGVLATLAVYGVRKYVYSSKTTEAIHMIGSIKSAEESYRSETFKYAGAAPDKLDADANFYPKGGFPGKYKADWTNTSHSDYANVWGPLGVLSDSPVLFEYVVVAGTGALVNPPRDCTGISWGASGSANTGPYYIVKAQADQNGDSIGFGDGKMSCFTSCNLTGEIFRAHEDE